MSQYSQPNILTQIKQIAPPLTVQIKLNKHSEDNLPEIHQIINYQLKTFHRRFQRAINFLNSINIPNLTLHNLYSKCILNINTDNIVNLDNSNNVDGVQNTKAVNTNDFNVVM